MDMVTDRAHGFGNSPQPFLLHGGAPVSKYYNVPFIVTAGMNYFQASSLNKTLFRFHQSPNEPLEVPQI